MLLAGFVFAWCFWLFHGQPTPRGSRSGLTNAATRLNAPSDQVMVKKMEAIQARRDHLDQTVWAKELLAQQHEAVFIQLWDDLRTQEKPFFDPRSVCFWRTAFGNCRPTGDGRSQHRRHTS